MNENVFYQSHPANSEALEIKRIMEEGIERSGLPKKVVAIDLGVPDATLSHYLSPRCGFTIPAHLVGRFCEVIQDWTLMTHLTSTMRRRRRIA